MKMSKYTFSIDAKNIRIDKIDDKMKKNKGECRLSKFRCE